MEYHEKMKNKVWNFDSAEQPSPEINCASNPPTPIEFYSSDVANSHDLDELQAFTLSPFRAYTKNEHQLSPNMHKHRSKTMHISEEQSNKRAREKQQLRKSKGPTSKTKIKLQEQIRSNQQLLAERQAELSRLNEELKLAEEQCRQRSKQQQDIGNNQEMLRLKENQLNNLKHFHGEIVQTTRNDIKRERAIRQEKQQLLARRSREVEDYRGKLANKNRMKHYIDQLTTQKKRLNTCLDELRKVEEAKLAVRSEAIRDIVEELVNKNKKEIEKQCEAALRVIHEAEAESKSPSQLKTLLQAKGVKPTDYYTYTQLKYVPEFNFKISSEARQIMALLDGLVLPAHIEPPGGEDPAQLRQISSELARLEDIRRLAEAEIRQKEDEIEQLQRERDQVLGNLKELRSKKESK